MSRPWWIDPVVYQIYPRSFADANADGSGDLKGITGKLDYLKKLGVDAIWMSPIYVSPQADGGYDVSDYYHIDPLYGNDSDLEELINEAHRRNLKVIMDIVPNHTSSAHRWFQNALKAGPNSPERDFYWFVDSKEDLDEQGKPLPRSQCTPPNNWGSIFGGAAWTRLCDRKDAPGSSWEKDTQWYLHCFDPEQPDLNWNNPKVREEFLAILDYWLAKGVDGFRIDVPQALMKDPRLPDLPPENSQSNIDESLSADPRFDQDEIHPIYQQWRAVLNRYGDAKMMIGELWVSGPRRNKYLRDDEMHSGFSFDFLLSDWNAEALRRVLSPLTGPQAEPHVRNRNAWVLSNHDSVRHISRFGLEQVNRRPNGIGVDDEQPHYERGKWRAQSATALMLALPGSAYLYQGEELGLPDHLALKPEERHDPTFKRTNYQDLGRDGCRCPLPWQHNAPNLGFSSLDSSAKPVSTWLPQPDSYRDLSADLQVDNPDSMFSFYQKALKLRKDLGLGRRELIWVDINPEVLAFDLLPGSDSTFNTASKETDPIRVITTFASEFKGEMIDGKIVFSAGEGIVKRSEKEIIIPPYTCVWFAI